jgi:hypothetical protein
VVVDPVITGPITHWADRAPDALDELIERAAESTDEDDEQ